MTSPYYRTPSVWNNLLIGGGCVRFDELSSTGASVVPRLHMNSAHTNVGILDVYIDWSESGYKKLHFDTAPGGTIVTMSCWPDETLTEMGITVGASGGTPHTALKVFKNGKQIHASSPTLYDPYANLWCFWVWAPSGQSPIKAAVDNIEDRLDGHDSTIADILSRLDALEGQ